MSSPDEELWYAAKYGDEDIVHSAIRKTADINWKYINGFSPIHQACHRNHANVVKILIDNNCNINAQTKDGLTPLHQACYNGNAHIASMLLGEGADANLQDKHGNTALHDAVSHNKEALYLMLLSNGADKSIRNKRGQLAEDMASNDIVKMKIQNFMKFLDIPEEIRRMDSAAVESFIHALEVGVYQSYHVRLMVVGHFGVGKTTLTKGLLGDDATRAVVESTNGIDVFIGRCYFNKFTHAWKQVKVEEDDVAQYDLNPEISNKIFRLIKNKHKEREKKSAASRKSTSPKKNRNKHGLFLELPNRLSKQQAAVGEDVVDGRKTDAGNDVVDGPSTTHRSNISDSLSKLGFDLVDGPSGAQGFDVVDGPSSSQGFDVVDGLPSINVPKQQTPVNEKNLLKKFIDGRDNVMSPQTENDVAVDLWDFGGQAVFYTTHQAFFSPRCIYILVFDMTKDLDEEVDDHDLDPGAKQRSSVISFLQFWISSIKTYARGHRAGFPSIILVGTHLDEIPESERDERISKVYNRIQETFAAEIATQQLILDKRLFMNAKDVNSTSFHMLRSLIIDRAKSHPNWGEELPMRWLPLQDAIQKLKRQHVKILTIEELKRINATELKVKLSDEELDVCLRFLHSLGHVLYYSDPRLREFVILDPTWLIDALRSFITAETFCKQDAVKRWAWTNMSQTGTITDECRELLWSREEYTLLKQYDTHLLRVMEKLDIITRPKEYQNGAPVDLPFYYVPCMVKDVNMDAVDRIRRAFSNDLTVKIIYKRNFLPAAVFNRLVAICLSMWPVRNKQLYSGCCVFVLDAFHSMLLMKRDHVILLSIIHKRKEADTSLLLCRNIQGFIEESLDKIAMTYTQDHVHDPCTKLYKVVSPWKSTEGQKCLHLDFECREDCKGLEEKALREMPTEMEMGRLASHLGKDNFITTAAELCLDLPTRQQIEADHPDSITKRMFYALHTWRRCSSEDRPDFRTLREMLLNLNMDEHILCKIYKSQRIEQKVDSNISREHLNVVPSDELLDQISSSIGREFFLLGIELGIECVTIERICRENTNNSLKLNREMLGHWKVHSKTRPTIRALAIAIVSVCSDFWRFCELINGEDGDD